MSTQNSLVLLNRIFTWKDGFPFVLVVDSLKMSAHYLLKEFTRNDNIIYISFETVDKPEYAAHFIDGTDLTTKSIIDKVNSIEKNGKTLILIDSLNHLPIQDLTSFVSSLILPSTIVLGVYHNDFEIKLTMYPNFPSHLTLLSYIASSIFEVEPYHKSDIDEEEIDDNLMKLKIPIVRAFNNPTYKLVVTNRRKSGRALTYKFIIKPDHEYEVYKESEDKPIEDESLLKDLTTFNLTTNTKQRLAKEQVELPYMQAQEELGSYSGAIVYEFEKDDDYDEEDPYEDPF